MLSSRTHDPIVTTSYRYKRPGKKRKAVALQGPAVVRKSAAGPVEPGDQSNFDAASTEVPQQPANEDRRPAIATSISRKRARLQRAEPAEPEPDDPEADAAMRAWLERAKWGHGPSQ